MTVDTITGSQLDRRVTLQQPVITRDADFGAEIKTWANVAIVWACISEDTASEAVQADERVLTRLISVRVRYRADISTTWRLVYGTRTFRIDGSLEVGRRRFLDLACVEYSDV